MIKNMIVRYCTPFLVFLLFVLPVCSDAQKSDQVTLVPFDRSFSQYDRLLSEFVSDGWVDYAGLKAHRATLDSIMTTIASAELETATTAEKLAFYINAYNTITLFAIVDNYPVKSIKDIDGVWDGIKWVVSGKEVTLNDLENAILRKEFQEPRIHCAIVCASISCPPLLSFAFVADSLDTQLDIAARAFLFSPERNYLDVDKGEARFSQIFEWYGEDFIDKYYDSSYFANNSKKGNAILGFFMSYYPEDEREQMKQRKWEVSYLDYDWSLNER